MAHHIADDEVLQRIGLMAVPGIEEPLDHHFILFRVSRHLISPVPVLKTGEPQDRHN